jgi:hypothetical protein
VGPSGNHQSSETNGEPAFVPGLRLNERFYAEAVKPILDAEFPTLRYSAALIGYGSDVLGYDTARSTDHEWGPRLLLFVEEADASSVAPIRDALSRRLPPVFRSYSTHFGPPDAEGVRLPQARHAGPIDHKVEVHVPRRWFQGWLGVDPFETLSPADWLLVPQHQLLEVTAGRVYYDGLGDLTKVRAKLAYFPQDVWVYLLACQWRRIAQQEAFVGRTGEVGDDLGSRLVASALVRDLMRLCFLMERRYAPYSKWFGTAFSRLDAAPHLGPLVHRVLVAATWEEREEALCAAYQYVAERHNALGITSPLDPNVSPYYGRPFRVIHADRFVEAIDRAIADPSVRAIVDRVGWIGATDQFGDAADLLDLPDVYTRLRPLYE